MDENEGAGLWLRYCSGNGDDGRLRCCHEMVRTWQSCSGLRCENGGFEAGAAMAAA